MAPRPQPLWHDDEPTSIGVDNPLWHTDCEMDEDPLLLSESSLDDSLETGSLQSSTIRSDSRRQSSIESITGTSDFATSFYESAGFAARSDGKPIRTFRPKRFPKKSRCDPCLCFFVLIVLVAVTFYVTSDGSDGSSNAGPVFEPYVCPAALATAATSTTKNGSVGGAGDGSSGGLSHEAMHLAMEEYASLDSVCAVDETTSRAQQECMCQDPTQPLDANDKTAAKSLPKWQHDLDDAASQTVSNKLTIQNGSSNGENENVDVVFLGESLLEWRGASSMLEQVNGIDIGTDGERCSSLLFKLENGHIPDSLNPKVWWITIGTNDVEDLCALSGVHAGVSLIVEKIQLLRPDARIVLNASTRTTKSDFRLRHLDQRLACIAESTEGVEYFDASPVSDDDDLVWDVTYSATSATTQQDIWAAMVETINKHA